MCKTGLMNENYYNPTAERFDSEYDRGLDRELEPTKYVLTSNPLCNSAGIVRWLVNVNRTDPKFARDFLRDAYNLPEDIAAGLMDGLIPFTYNGDTVEFQV